MAELADGFIALPGGLGTLEELAEVASWAQLGLHAKPIGLLGPDGYWDGAAGLARPGRDDGFIAPDHRALVAVDADLDALLARFEALGAARPALGVLGAVGRGRLRGLRAASASASAWASATGPASTPGAEKSSAAIARIAGRSGSCESP